jgi:hypothetical protein
MENTPQIQSFQQVPKQCKFNELPKQTQERLITKVKSKDDCFVFNGEKILDAYILIPLTLIWFGILFYLTNDYLWSKFQSIFFSIISFFAAFLLIHSIYKLTRWFSLPIKNCLIITPYYVIDIESNEMSYWNMDQLNSVKGTNISQSGSYVTTQIELSLENGSKIFSVNNIKKAEEIVEKIDSYKKLFLEATARNDINYLNANDDFIELRNQTVQPSKSSNKYLKYAITGFTSLIISAGLMFVATSLNNYFDDVKSWNDAESINRASSYRKYLQTHENGRWYASAEKNLQTIYNEAEQKYQESLNKGFDPKAVEAVKQAIRYAKETKNYKVKLIFERSNLIPADIVEILKKDNEVIRLLAIGVSLSDENMNTRERELFSRITDAFNIVIPNDILEFTDECSDECIVFLVKYKIDSDNIYYDLRQKKLSHNDRTWYPGIWFDWTFDIKTLNNPVTYDFQLTSDPAEEITYESTFDGENIDKDEFTKLLDIDKNLLYDSMVISAFDDFKANLVYRMGIGEEPIRKVIEDEKETEKPSVITKEKTGK